MLAIIFIPKYSILTYSLEMKLYQKVMESKTKSGLFCSYQVSLKKKKRTLVRVNMISGNIRVLIKSGLHAKAISQEFNQYHDLMKLLLDI